MAELETIVVVGASLGGTRAAEALRREGFAGRLVLVGAEGHFPPYDRPPLSKEVLLGSWEAERARLRVEPGLAVELELGRRAVALDPEEAVVALEDGSSIPFDGLVVATGGDVRMLPGIPPGTTGVHVLRTVEDSVALRDALAASPEVVVIGAGWIGSEVAAACRGRGVTVHVVEALEAPMVRALGPELGNWVAKLHRAEGVDLRLGVGVDEVVVEGGAVAGVRLADGERLACQVVVVAVGVAPATAGLEGSGLVIDNGVRCDATGRALGTERVVAVGDVACWDHPLFRRPLRVEHWANAIEQADWAAKTLLAAPHEGEPFVNVPYFWSDQYGKKIQYVGVAGTFAGVVEGDLDAERFVAIYTDADRLVGALCVNAPGRMIRYRRLIADDVGPEAVESILPRP